MMILLALALALSAECGPLALVADDCAREATVWARAVVAGSGVWVVATWPEAA